MRIVFSPAALEAKEHFKQHDRKTAEKIRQLIEDIMQNPCSGLGKPEPLKHDLAGYWSRRISREHRLVYKVEDDTLYVASCRYHYR
ncbi:MAG: Txe/YoeB family addiction module toxin [Desulfovibrio sp.]|jgi:toxin YoeB|nr:Txe/YoeB family addiction module toxin [Desulfovibrio sp.]